MGLIRKQRGHIPGAGTRDPHTDTEGTVGAVGQGAGQAVGTTSLEGEATLASERTKKRLWSSVALGGSA